MNEQNYIGFSVCQYLDEIGEKFSLGSDNQIAKKLGITRSAISQYRNGTRAMDDYCAMQIASFLKINPMLVIATANEKREKSREKKIFWQEVQVTISTGGSLFYSLTLGVVGLEIFKRLNGLSELFHQACILCSIDEAVILPENFLAPRKVVWSQGHALYSATA